MTISRRRVLELIGAGAAFAAGPGQAQPSTDFDALLAQAASDTALLAGARADREGRVAAQATRAITPHVTPSNRKISEDAIKLIILFEVSSAATYSRLYRRPTWPAGQSGVTIGVGYDLGYATREWLREDWGGHLPTTTIATLSQVCGITGPAAQSALAKVAHVDIGWPTAEAQFRSQTLPRYVGQTVKVLPNAASLSDDSLGAMVSLVYNRGASFHKDGPRYREMRDIFLNMEGKVFTKVPDDLTRMERLWKGKPASRGLITRRQLEAVLFTRGLTPPRLG
jgi:GH24 family phage-related lysozyme (muramidase)